MAGGQWRVVPRGWCLGEADQHDFGAGAVGAVQTEGDAVFSFDAGLSSPGLGFGGEEIGEGTKAPVALEEGDAFAGDFIAEGFGDELGLLGRGAGGQGGREHDLIETCGGSPGAQAGVELLQHSQTGPAWTPHVPEPIPDQSSATHCQGNDQEKPFLHR